MIIVNKKRITKQHTKRSSYPITHTRTQRYTYSTYLGVWGISIWQEVTTVVVKTHTHTLYPLKQQLFRGKLIRRLGKRTKTTQGE